MSIEPRLGHFTDRASGGSGYKAKALESMKEAAEHRAMVKTYDGQKIAIAAAKADHCNKLASLSDSQSAEYEQLAAAHETAAKP